MKNSVFLSAALLVGILSCGSCGSSQVDTGDPCLGQQSRCEGQLFQVCGSSDTFVEEQKCAEQSTCDVDMGCVACDPNAALSCSGDSVVECNNGSIGRVVEECDEGTCQDGRCGGGGGAIGGCASGAELIYLVDVDTNFVSFDPSKLGGAESPFQIIGSLSCPAGLDIGGGAQATPFSMSVDRNGTAWVLYSSGELFQVSTTDASCNATNFSPGQAGFDLFGMGFVSDSANSNSETLYVAGTGDIGGGQLGRLDQSNFTIQSLGPYPSAEYSPELTGTGEGKLFGYFPGAFSTFIAELNKTSGSSLGGQWALSPAGAVTAWAFAHWGGRFYVFTSVQDFFSGVSNSVVEYDPQTGNETTVIPDSPFRVVGAGVSTCAPIVVD